MVGRVLCCKGVVTNVLGGFLLSSTTLLTPCLASFVCSYWVSSTSCTYHALVTSSLQMRKISRHSRSKYKVTLRTRKRVKQMVFFYFFLFSETQSVLGWCSTKECTYTYVIRMYIWVESTMSSLISVLHILFFLRNFSHLHSWKKSQMHVFLRT